MISRENKPVFIALEGGEGAGKSTQAQLLLTRLQQEGRHATLVHEPGTTPLGQHLREYLKSKQKIATEAELLLFEASRAQLMAEVIQPSLRPRHIRNRRPVRRIVHCLPGLRTPDRREKGETTQRLCHRRPLSRPEHPPGPTAQRRPGKNQRTPTRAGIRAAEEPPAGHRGNPEVRGPAG